MTADLPGAEGDFHGRPTRRLDNGRCWLEFLAQAGPRIVRFGLTGGESIMAETPEAGWDGPHGRFELFGGHRVWFAPERAECSIPDSSGLRLETLDDVSPGLGLRLVGAVQEPTGLRRTMELRLAPDAAAVEVRHVVANVGDQTHELAVWPITQLKLGGVARVELPAPVPQHAFVPNRNVVLWPYSSWTDERLSFADAGVAVRAIAAPMVKLGCLSRAGRATYEREGVLFSKTFDPANGAKHPDMGVNVEIYSDQGCIELETLGPLVTLGPGESARHDEFWELRSIG